MGPSEARIRFGAWSRHAEARRELRAARWQEEAAAASSPVCDDIVGRFDSLRAGRPLCADQAHFQWPTGGWPRGDTALGWPSAERAAGPSRAPLGGPLAPGGPLTSDWSADFWRSFAAHKPGSWRQLAHLHRLRPEPSGAYLGVRGPQLAADRSDERDSEKDREPPEVGRRSGAAREWRQIFALEGVAVGPLLVGELAAWLADSSRLAPS